MDVSLTEAVPDRCLHDHLPPSRNPLWLEQTRMGLSFGPNNSWRQVCVDIPGPFCYLCYIHKALNARLDIPAGSKYFPNSRAAHQLGLCVYRCDMCGFQPDIILTMPVR